MKSKAFTLLELMVVIIIIGILAGISLPGYMKTKEHALGNEAKANLKLMAAAEKIYKMENSTYTQCWCYYPAGGEGSADCNGTSGCNTMLKLNLNAQNWVYDVAADATTFTAMARRGAGGVGCCKYTLTHNDADGEPDPTSCP